MVYYAGASGTSTRHCSTGINNGQRALVITIAVGMPIKKEKPSLYRMTGYFSIVDRSYRE
jgi:hypothetical protein